MEHGELVGRARDGPQPLAVAVLHHVLEAPPVDQLAHEVAARALREAAERDDAWDAEPLEAAQRHGLADERHRLGLAGVLAEDLERELGAGHAIANGPDLTAATLAEACHGFVARGHGERRQRRLSAHVLGAARPVPRAP